MSNCIITTLQGISNTLNNVNVGATHTFSCYGDILHEGVSALQLPTGTTAQRPGSPDTGYIRYNTDLSTVEIYNTNSEWEALVKSVIGTEQNNPAPNAAAILNDDPYARDGVYYLEHNGGGVYQTFVSMSFGGWILVGKIPASPADTTNPWSYSGGRWSQTSVTNEADCQNTNDGDALNRGYYQYTTTVGFRMGMQYWHNNLFVARAGVTAKDAFTGSASNTSLSRDQFLDIITESHTEWDNQPHCNRNGFNRTDSSNTGMRFGHTMNNENECNSNDSAIGWGCYTNNQNTSGDRNCAAGGFRWNPTTRYPRSGFIFVK